jgi:hypothetical protein
MTRFSRLALFVAVAAITAACGGSPKSSARIGPAGGTVSTPGGVTLKVAPGAVAVETEVKVTETQPRHGALRRIEIEPKGLALAAPSLVSVQISGDSTTVKLVRIESTESGEVEHALETEKHSASHNARQAEIEHLGTFEVRGAATCDVACDTGFECDDGACKPHDEVEAADDDGMDDPATHDAGDDHGVDPGTGTAPATCPDGMELDASDGTCKAHGGGAVDPAPAPAPAPAPTTCPDGMELDASDGICKPHGGSGGGQTGP